MPLHLLLAALIATLASACSPADADIAAGDAPAPAIAPVVPVAAPDDAPAIATPSTGRHHGNWRLVATDDPHDAALMAFSIQSDADDARGTGDFVLFQPFCDAVAGAPITGIADCELIGLGAAFDRVDINGERIVLVFHPTADGLPHRLELRAEGDALVGDYVSEANRIRRAVIARHPPADEP